ncbi:hypothetical protein DM02DRAFT_647808 [Periconia macrospinosa]|uniref:Uncharacterized protein n=1 Tax=Periconia macrospinosa TaxID=97972 RepID=A0A2V1ED13_9PLEO|nr:hypothetical protein DM02DRAFT_647808 [Periconia macrospinosa]
MPCDAPSVRLIRLKPLLSLPTTANGRTAQFVAAVDGWILMLLLLLYASLPLLSTVEDEDRLPTIDSPYMDQGGPPSAPSLQRPDSDSSRGGGQRRRQDCFMGASLTGQGDPLHAALCTVEHQWLVDLFLFGRQVAASPLQSFWTSWQQSSWRICGRLPAAPIGSAPSVALDILDILEGRLSARDPTEPTMHFAPHGEAKNSFILRQLTLRFFCDSSSAGGRSTLRLIIIHYWPRLSRYLLHLPDD